jgi:hypothetical protein
MSCVSIAARLLFGPEVFSGHHPQDSLWLSFDSHAAQASPFFNIVVADKRVRRDGRFIEAASVLQPIAKGGEDCALHRTA